MQAILAAILPYLLQMLETPAFQAVLKSILDQLVKNIASGVPVMAATQLATGQATAAASLHLTGNPIADVEGFLATFKLGNPPLAPPAVVVKPAGSFTS